jgi:uncharacterized protein (TIGR02266 family)
MAEELRRYIRRAVKVEFRGKDTEGMGDLLFDSADLSAGGTFLKSDVLLELGDRLSLEFQIPETNQTVQAQCRVAWVRRFPTGDEPAGMGIEFLTLADDDRKALSEFVSKS